jgi:MAF protein
MSASERSELQFILASGSPRRRLLLPLVGPVTRIVNADIDETPGVGELPDTLANRLARSKALRAAELTAVNEETTISADTVVALDGEVLGKPRDAAHAKEMLQSLRAREHEVITGVAALAANGEIRVRTVSTRVRMRDYTDLEIDRYIESGDPFDKAGSYAIQNQDFHPVESIEGCFPNVVGLPLCAVRVMTEISTADYVSLAVAPCDLCAHAKIVLE